MTPFDLSKLQHFLVVAEKMSFAKAAAELGLSRSALSHSITKLENDLSIRLFHRTTRAVALTESGEALFHRLKSAMLEVQEALSIEKNIVRGRLRINVPRVAAMLVIANRIAEFKQSNPQIQLEVSVDDEASDVIADGYDAGIRFEGAISKDLNAVKVSTPVRMLIAGSPEYFSKHGHPKSPKDLVDHSCIGYRLSASRELLSWKLRNNKNTFSFTPNTGLILNDPYLSIKAAESGAGLIFTAEIFLKDAIEEGSLVPTLSQWAPTFPSLYLYYSNRRHLPGPLSTLISFLKN